MGQKEKKIFSVFEHAAGNMCFRKTLGGGGERGRGGRIHEQ